MRSERLRGRDIQCAIREVLLRDWDPIGVGKDEDGPRDEYDAYIGEIHACLARGESEEAIARHLCAIEEEKMGLGRVDPKHRLDVARTLQALAVHAR